MVKIRKGDKVILGLSNRNMKSLAKGKTLKLNLKDVEYGDIEISIFSGTSDVKMYLDFIEKKGPTTKIK
jgi:hypothetical protein